MGTFTGGLLWTEHEKGSTAPPCEAKGMDPSVRGKVLAARLDGTKWHGVTPANGYFNSRALGKLSGDDWQQLEAL
eukprot:12397918-Prorocentrum_lima.AAC.1